MAAAAPADRLVELWLCSLGLSLYVEAFRDNGYDELEICKRISFEDLDAIGVSDAHHRGLLLQSVDRLRREGVSSIYFTLEPSESVGNGCAAGSCVSTLSSGKRIQDASNDLARAPRGKDAADKVQGSRQPQPLPPGSVVPPGTAASVAAVSGVHFRHTPSHAPRNGGHTYPSMPTVLKVSSDNPSAADIRNSEGSEEVECFLVTRALPPPPLPPPLVLLPEKASRSGRHAAVAVTADQRRPGVRKQSSFLKAVTSFLFGRSKKNDEQTAAVRKVAVANGASNSSAFCSDVSKRFGAQPLASQSRSKVPGELCKVACSPHACLLLPNASAEAGSDATTRDAELIAHGMRPMVASGAGRHGSAESHAAHRAKAQQHQAGRLPQAVEGGSGSANLSEVAAVERASRQAATSVSSPRGGRRPVSADVTALLLRLPPPPRDCTLPSAPFCEHARRCFTGSGCGEWQASNVSHGCSCGLSNAVSGNNSSTASVLPTRPLFFTPQVSRRGLAQRQHLQQSRQPAASCQPFACACQLRQARRNAEAEQPRALTAPGRPVPSCGDVPHSGRPAASPVPTKAIMCDASTSYHSDVCSVAVRE